MVLRESSNSSGDWAPMPNMLAAPYHRGVPVFLDVSALRAALAGGPWGPIDHVPSTGSTNADLAEVARAGSASGRVLASSHQSRGRGRLARTWEAPPDTSLACSVLVEPRRPTADWGWLPLIVGIAVVDGLGDAAGLSAELKWPNDVLVGGRKICGILCETVVPPTAEGAGGRLQAVLGFGVNVALTADRLPVPTATSVRLEGSDATATEVLAAVLRSLGDLIARWDAGASLAGEYADRCGTIGREVVVHLGQDRIAGLASGVRPDGALLVDTPSGRRPFVAGDVTHLR